MSFFRKAMEKQDKKSQVNENGCFSNIIEFFEVLRTAPNYRVNDDVEHLKKELNNFCPLFENILLDDDLFSKDVQKSFLNTFNNLINIFYLSLDYPWMFNKKRVVVAGRFSAGKSSVINALIGDKLLPTDVKPTTAISAQITNLNIGNSAIIKTINYEDPKIIKTSNLAKLVKEEIEKFPIHMSEVIEYVVINNNTLGDDIVIIDTPGFDPSDKKNLDKDKNLMLKEFNEADCIVWVVDINDGDISRDALEILKNINNQELIVVVNKSDTKIVEKERKSVLNKIKDTLLKNNIKFNKIIAIGKNKNGLNFNKNINLLKNLIKNLKIQEFNIFKDINESLDYVYKNLVEDRKLFLENIDFYEDIKMRLQNDYWNTIEELANLDPNKEKFILDIVKKVLNTQNLLNDYVRKEFSMWETEYPIFGDDKYYIKMSDFQEFEDIRNKIVNAYIELGYYEGLLRQYITDRLIDLKELLEKTEQHIKDINKAKKEIEEIEFLYMKYQYANKEIILDFSNL